MMNFTNERTWMSLMAKIIVVQTELLTDLQTRVSGKRLSEQGLLKMAARLKGLMGRLEELFDEEYMIPLIPREEKGKSSCQKNDAT